MPPRRFRFVGGGDFSGIGHEQLGYLVALGGLRPDDAVLDVGCGIGRVAIPLTQYLSEEATYEGFDVVPSWIRWCAANITARHPRFRFLAVDVHNEKYNPHGALDASDFRFPYAGSSFTFAFASSVFTHMPITAVDNYLGEVSRVLRPGGRLLSTFFVLNEDSRAAMATARSPMSFEHERDGYWLVDPALPELAIAYEEERVRELHRRHGLEVAEPLHYGSWSGGADGGNYQDVIVATRPASG